MITLRCPFCLTLNAIDLAKAADRPRCGKCERPMLLDRPVKVSEEDFRKTVVESGATVLVDFFADWCAPCKTLAPVLDDLARENTGKMLVVKVDADHAPGLSTELGVRGLPTLILFRGGAEAGRVVGADPAGVRQMVKGALGSPA